MDFCRKINIQDDTGFMTEKFKYVVKILTPKYDEKTAIEEGTTNVETALKVCFRNCKSKSLQNQARTLNSET